MQKIVAPLNIKVITSTLPYGKVRDLLSGKHNDESIYRIHKDIIE